MLISKFVLTLLKNKKMNNFKILFIALMAIALLTMTSCGDDDVDIPIEPEVITTLNYTLTGGGTTVTLSFLDPDGDGGNAPTITSGTLAANTTYSGSIELLNESDPDDVEDITEEVAEEDEEHQFFFQTTGGISVDYDDADADGNPLGLANTLTTGAAGDGSVTITLRHEPNKGGDGVAEGNIANAGGETDIEVTFDVTVQ